MASYSSLLMETPQLPILLVFSPAAPAQRAEVDRLLDKIRLLLNPGVQVMRVSETTHPEVVSSFGFSSVPGFVLLQRGLELWRYSGPADSPELFAQLDSQMVTPLIPPQPERQIAPPLK